MVDLNLDYELNHIYKIIGDANGPSTGAISFSTDFDLVLFEKSLALASDLKRLPVIRGVKGTLQFQEGIAEKMISAGVQFLEVLVNLYNGDIDPDNLIDCWVGYVFCVGQAHASLPLNVFGIHLPEVAWDYEGGVLSSDTLNLRISVTTDDPCGDASLANPLFNCRIFFEIDWTPITSKQLDSFIREHLYARGD